MLVKENPVSPVRQKPNIMIKIPFFKKAPNISLGIDIGTSSIKMVELTKDGDVLKLTNYAEIVSPKLERGSFMPMQMSSMQVLSEEIAALIKKTIKEAQIKTKTVSMSVPVFSSFITTMELPFMTKEEVAQAVTFQARQYIPVPISEVVLDWTLLKDIPDNGPPQKIPVLLVAVPQEVIHKYTDISVLSGFQLKALEVETFSLVRSLVQNDKSAICLVDFGSRNTNIAVVDDGSVRMCRTTETSGGELTKVLAGSLNIDFKRAEELKQERGVKKGGGEEEISRIILPLIDIIFSEIEKITAIYFQKSGKKVMKFILTGGAANLPGLVEHFVEKFGREVRIGDPFRGIECPPILAQILREMAPSFSVAAGLAMRELKEI